MADDTTPTAEHEITDMNAELAKFDPVDDTDDTQGASGEATGADEAEPDDQEDVKADAAETPSEGKDKPKADDDDLTDEMRIRRLHIEARESKRAAAQAQRDLDYLRGTLDVPRDEAVAIEARQHAAQLTRDAMWNRDCDRIGHDGRDNIKGFDDTLTSLKENFGGGVPSAIIGTAMEVAPGREAAILNYLGKNLDLAESIMSMTPVKAGAAMAKIADKLDKKAEPSKAPAPLKPITPANNTRHSSNGYFEGISEAAFMKMEAKQRRERFN